MSSETTQIDLCSKKITLAAVQRMEKREEQGKGQATVEAQDRGDFSHQDSGNRKREQ